MADRLARLNPGATWLNLLTTVSSAYGPAPRERLTGTGPLADWLACEDLTVPITEADVATARELREALRELLWAHLDERPPAPAELATVNLFAAADTAPHLTYTDGLRRSGPADLRAALGRVARQAADHLTGPERHHLHTCADATCRMAYLDPTGRRRWCAADACGVRARVRAHRARQQVSE